MPTTPPREFPIREELYVTDSFEELWPLLDQANVPTQVPPEANDVIGTTFPSIVSKNVDPWFLQPQESDLSVPPLLLEHDNLVNINATFVDQDIEVGRAYDLHHDQVINPESLNLPPLDPTLLAAQESAGPPPHNSRAEKGKRKLNRELPRKWKKRVEKLKSLHIPDNYDIHQLDHDELAGTEDLLYQGGMVVAKKQDHNAKERERRMKLNASYLALGALLPQSRRSKKRWAAPSIIDKMVHYIPELKTEIEELISKKEELQALNNNSSIREKKELDSTTVSVHEVSGREELIIQVCMKMKEGMEDGEDNTFSYLVQNLEVGELLLLGASTNNLGKDRVCYNLHVQMRGSCSSSHGSNNVMTAAFKEKVFSWLRSNTKH